MTMPYSLDKHMQLRQKALIYIQKGQHQDFLDLIKNSICTVEESYEEPIITYPDRSGIYWTNDDYSDGSYISGYETKTRIVQKNYFNVEDYHSFLNAAMINKNKETVTYILQKAISTAEPVVFTKNEFQAFCKGSPQESKTHEFNQIVEGLEHLRKKVVDLHHREKSNRDTCSDPYYNNPAYAYKLIRNLQLEMINLVTSPCAAENISDFKSNCDAHLKKALDSPLSTHRGCKEILVNLGLAIAGLVVFYLAALAVNYHKTGGKHIFFHPKTASEKIIESNLEAVNNFKMS